MDVKNITELQSGQSWSGDQSRRQVIGLAVGAILLPFTSQPTQATSFDMIYGNVDRILLKLRFWGDPDLKKKLPVDELYIVAQEFLTAELAPYRSDISVLRSDPKIVTTENRFATLSLIIDVALRYGPLDHNVIGAVDITLYHSFRSSPPRRVHQEVRPFPPEPFQLEGVSMADLSPLIEALKSQLNIAVMKAYKDLPQDY